jgi:hypothetical protein
MKSCHEAVGLAEGSRRKVIGSGTHGFYKVTRRLSQPGIREECDLGGIMNHENDEIDIFLLSES